jgi:hypothetical protein
MWNRADLIMYLLFIVSVVLRFTLDEKRFQYARTGYAVTLALCYLRFMQNFYVNKDIGPKVIMIKRMVRISNTKNKIFQQFSEYDNSALRWFLVSFDPFLDPNHSQTLS